MMNDEGFSTPILFLIFNRPHYTEKVFQCLRELKPKYLYVSADGPRRFKQNDIEQCNSARKIIDKVDWTCEVKTRYNDDNMGCKMGVSSGIDWFFDNVEEGIILEDDCLPDQSFFSMCGKLLDYYRNVERVMHIGGANFQDGKNRGNASYYFSSIAHIWGWATWRRAWKNYDVSIASYPDLVKDNQFERIFPNERIRKYWLKNFDLVYSNKKDTWDIQWMYAMSIHHGLAIIPNANLVSNIGFESSATHTFNPSDPMANRSVNPLNHVTHPSEIFPDAQADAYTYRKYLDPNKFRKLRQLLRQYV